MKITSEILSKLLPNQFEPRPTRNLSQYCFEISNNAWTLQISGDQYEINFEIYFESEIMAIRNNHVATFDTNDVSPEIIATQVSDLMRRARRRNDDAMLFAELEV